MSDFGGKTITGDIQHYGSTPVEQADPQLFLDALDQILSAPGVEAVRWNQYTPYFNDGDACTFSIYSAYVKVKGGDDEAGDYGDGFLSTYDLYEYGPGGYDDKVYANFNGIPGELISDALNSFEGSLESGAHWNILQEKFGDPATVTATKAGFDVDFYEHD